MNSEPVFPLERTLATWPVDMADMLNKKGQLEEAQTFLMIAKEEIETRLRRLRQGNTAKLLKSDNPILPQEVQAHIAPLEALLARVRSIEEGVERKIAEKRAYKPCSIL